MKYILADAISIAKSHNGECLSESMNRAQDKLKWKCKNGHIWYSSFSNVKNSKTWCGFCARHKPDRFSHSIDDCVKYASSHGGLCLSERYVNEKLRWKCGCGYEWLCTFSQISSHNSWCAKCANNIKHTIDMAKVAAKEKSGACLSEKYVNCDADLVWECKNQHIWEASYNNVVNAGSWCKICLHNSIRYTLEYCKNIAKKNGGECISQEYTNDHSKLEWRCYNGHIFVGSLNYISFVGDKWCIHCNKAPHREKFYKKCIDIASLHLGRCLSGNYINNRSKMSWECHKGHTWAASFNSIYNQKHWCPVCSSLVSKAQIEIYTILSNYFPTIEMILNDTKTIKPMHLDIFIPSLNIGIEYDGEYWHYSEWALSHGALERMKTKDDKCEEFGIKLIRIREKEYKQCSTSVTKDIFRLIKKSTKENGD